MSVALRRGSPNALAQLCEDHRLVLEAVGALERIAFAVAGGVPLPRVDVAALLEFFQRFVEGAHHAKEELALFPAVVREGRGEDAALLVIFSEEYGCGRRLLAELMSATALAKDDFCSRAVFVRAAVAYTTHLRAQIHAEEASLFPVALRVLRRGTLDALRAHFARIEAEAISPGPRATVVASVRCLAAHGLEVGGTGAGWETGVGQSLKRKRPAAFVC